MIFRICHLHSQILGHTVYIPENFRNFSRKLQIIEPNLEALADLQTLFNMGKKAIIAICCDVDIAVIHHNGVVAYQQNLASVPNPAFRAHEMSSALQP
jgi:hypothetical protein